MRVGTTAISGNAASFLRAPAAFRLQVAIFSYGVYFFKIAMFAGLS